MVTLVSGSLVLGLLGHCIWRARGWLRQARNERRADPRAALRDGPFLLVGVVEPGEGASPPVTVRIRQAGKESLNKGKWSHRWEEIERTTEARPFVVHRDDGVRVTVEPGDRVVVHDSLTRVEATANDRERVRIAEVEAGARVYVTGQLCDVVDRSDAGVYRTASVMPRLVGSRIRPVILATEEPGDTAMRQLWAYLSATFVVSSVLALLIATCYGPYFLRAIVGRVHTGTIQGVHYYEEWVKEKHGGHWEDRYEARVEWATGPGDLWSEVFPITEDLYGCAGGSQCNRITVLDAKWGPWRSWQLGSTPMLVIWQVGLLLIASGATLVLVLMWLIGTRPWYMRRRIVNKGKGRLELPARAQAKT
jgi:hypothetical protein